MRKYSRNTERKEVSIYWKRVIRSLGIQTCGKGTPKKPYYCSVNRHLRLASVSPHRDLQVSNTIPRITTEEVYL